MLFVQKKTVIKNEYEKLNKKNMNMNMNKWAIDVLNSHHRLAIPIMTHPGIDMIGKNVKDAVTNGQIHADAIIALNRKYPADGVTAIMDLTVEAEAFGADVKLCENEVPSVIGRLVTNYKEVENLEIPSLQSKRVPEYLKANAIVAQSIIDKPSFGGAIGPFSLAGRLFDMTEIMMGIYTVPNTINLLLEKCTIFLKEYIKAIKEQGMNGVMIAEPAAGLLSNEDALTYSSKYIKEIVDELQDESFIIVLHNCGNTGHCTESMVKTGAKALHFGNKIDMVETLDKVPSDVIVMGNLDPVGLFKQATPGQMLAATKILLKRTEMYRNFIISSGCDTPPGVSEANIEAFYSALNNNE